MPKYVASCWMLLHAWALVGAQTQRCSITAVEIVSEALLSSNARLELMLCAEIVSMSRTATFPTSTSCIRVQPRRFSTDKYLTQRLSMLIRTSDLGTCPQSPAAPQLSCSLALPILRTDTVSISCTNEKAVYQSIFMVLSHLRIPCQRSTRPVFPLHDLSPWSFQLASGRAGNLPPRSSFASNEF